MSKQTMLAVLLIGLAGGAGAADFRPETMGVATLDRAPGPNWVWANDFTFGFMADGRTYLLDVGTGEFLGMLSTGSMFLKLDIPADRKLVYNAATYYERVVRGKRTDVINIFDPQTLDFVGEIPIPAKRLTSIPTLINSGITNDQRFLLVYNMTPAQSVSVIDLAERRFVGEVITPGCGMTLPGERRFRMLCADGSLLSVELDAAGKEARRARSPRFFDPQRDPLTEKPVRIGDDWWFVSFEGMVQPMDLAGELPRLPPSWSLLSDADRADGWRIGGIELLGVHAKTRRLYALMHQGGPDTHKDPGSEVWVYDLGTRQRLQRIALRDPATSILITQADEPLLVAVLIGVPNVEVYSATTGQHQRTIGEIGHTVALLQNY